MELKYLNTLKTILETGSFQNAARKLNYTQSTVTFQIQQLEQELSIKLFEKIGRKMILTQAGQELLPYIDNILQSAEQICNYGKSISELAGTLRVAIPESFLSYKMQPILKTFREQAPNVKLILKALNCYEIQDEIINGRVDIGVHYDVGGYPPSVLIESLADFEVTLVASPVIASEQLDFLKQHQRKPLNLISSDAYSIYEKMFAYKLFQCNHTLFC